MTGNPAFRAGRSNHANGAIIVKGRANMLHIERE
jgi:hypothetical protein